MYYKFIIPSIIIIIILCINVSLYECETLQKIEIFNIYIFIYWLNKHACTVVPSIRIYICWFIQVSNHPNFKLSFYRLIYSTALTPLCWMFEKKIFNLKFTAKMAYPCRIPAICRIKMSTSYRSLYLLRAN